MNSSPAFFKSPARKILADEMNKTILKLSMKESPKVFTQCLLYQLFQETNSQIIFPFILKRKKFHESIAN